MTGKPLSALLQILRSAGVAEYTLITEPQGGNKTTVHLKLRDATPAKSAAKEEPAGIDVPDPDPPPQDWRFALEDLSNLNANAARGKLGNGRQ